MIKKLIANIGVNAYRTLGLTQYVYLVYQFLLSVPRIVLGARVNLSYLDKKMSKLIKVSVYGYKFLIDCKYTDDLLVEQSYTFGLVREIYIRNCYFKHHQLDFNGIKNVIDLGGNRGVFSLLAANFCEKVVYVEPQEQYRPVFIHNMKTNGFENYVIENVFVGSGGKFTEAGANTKSLAEIIKENSFDVVDFLKIDIEGAEFALFKERTSWLEKIKYLSMEVHRDYGDVQFILSGLEEYGFKTITCDQNLEIIRNVDCIDFIYAVNSKLETFTFS